MNAAYGTCALMECVSMKMAVLNVFANLDFSWHQMGVIVKVCAVELYIIFCFFLLSILLRGTIFLIDSPHLNYS